MSPIKIEDALAKFQSNTAILERFSATADIYEMLSELTLDERRAVLLLAAAALGLEYDEGTGQIWDPKAPRVTTPSDNSRYGRVRRRR